MAHIALTSDHGGKKSHNHVRKACPTLTFDHVGTNPIIISERPITYIHPVREHIPLLMEGLYTYIHLVREHIPLLMEWLCTHIWSWGNTSQQSYQNGPQSLTELPGNWPGASILLENGSFPYIRPARWNGQHSHLTWEELNPLAMTEWFSPYIWSSGNTSLYHIRMAS